MAPISNADFFFCKNFELESCRAVHRQYRRDILGVVQPDFDQGGGDAFGDFEVFGFGDFEIFGDCEVLVFGDFEDDSDKEKRLEMLIEQELSASGGCLGISNALHEI